jgi:hypothetical protein
VGEHLTRIGLPSRGELAGGRIPQIRLSVFSGLSRFCGSNTLMRQSSLILTSSDPASVG